MGLSDSLVSILILNWNGGTQLRQAIESVFSQTHRNVELVLVDNGSEDGSIEPVASLFSTDKRLRIIRNDNNLGYCGGMNVGIRACQGEFILGMNPDVVLEKDFIEQILKPFSDPQVGMAAPLAVRSSNTAVIDSVGTVCFKHLFATAHRAGQARGVTEEPSEVFGVIGAYSMYRKKMLEELSYSGKNGKEYFDEDFFTYYDEHDLQIRARWLGWRCMYVPSARATHVWRYSVKSGLIKHGPLYDRAFRNYYLSMVKNMTLSQFLTSLHLFFLHECGLLALSLVYRTPIIFSSKLKALPFLGSMLKKRRKIMTERRLSTKEFNAGLAGFWAYFRFLASVMLSEHEEGRLLSFSDSDQVGKRLPTDENS